MGQCFLSETARAGRPMMFMEAYFVIPKMCSAEKSVAAESLCSAATIFILKGNDTVGHAYLREDEKEDGL